MTVNTPTSAILSRGLAVEDHQNEYRKDALRKGKCLSIGIQVRQRKKTCMSVFLHIQVFFKSFSPWMCLQVDGPEEVLDSEDPSKFTSVGVQVEDGRGWEHIFKKYFSSSGPKAFSLSLCKLLTWFLTQLDCISWVRHMSHQNMVKNKNNTLVWQSERS